MSRARSFTKPEMMNAAAMARDMGIVVKLVRGEEAMLFFPDTHKRASVDTLDHGDEIDRELDAFAAKHGYG